MRVSKQTPKAAGGAGTKTPVSPRSVLPVLPSSSLPIEERASRSPRKMGKAKMAISSSGSSSSSSSEAERDNAGVAKKMNVDVGEADVTEAGSPMAVVNGNRSAAGDRAKGRGLLTPDPSPQTSAEHGHGYSHLGSVGSVPSLQGSGTVSSGSIPMSAAPSSASSVFDPVADKTTYNGLENFTSAKTSIAGFGPSPDPSPSHSRYPSTSTTNSISASALAYDPSSFYPDSNPYLTHSRASSASFHPPAALPQSHPISQQSQLYTMNNGSRASGVEESSGYGSTTDDEPTIKPDHSSGSSIRTMSSEASTSEATEGEVEGEGTPAGSPILRGNMGVGIFNGIGGLGTASSSTTSLSSTFPFHHRGNVPTLTSQSPFGTENQRHHPSTPIEEDADTDGECSDGDWPFDRDDDTDTDGEGERVRSGLMKRSFARLMPGSSASPAASANGTREGRSRRHRTRTMRIKNPASPSSASTSLASIPFQSAKKSPSRPPLSTSTSSSSSNLVHQLRELPPQPSTPSRRKSPPSPSASAGRGQRLKRTA